MKLMEFHAHLMESDRFQLVLLLGAKLGRFSPVKLLLLSETKNTVVEIESAKRGEMENQGNPKFQIQTLGNPQRLGTQHLHIGVTPVRRLLRSAAPVHHADVGPAAAAAAGRDLRPQVSAASACVESAKGLESTEAFCGSGPGRGLRVHAFSKRHGFGGGWGGGVN